MRKYQTLKLQCISHVTFWLTTDWTCLQTDWTCLQSGVIFAMHCGVPQ